MWLTQPSSQCLTNALKNLIYLIIQHILCKHTASPTPVFRESAVPPALRISLSFSTVLRKFLPLLSSPCPALRSGHSAGSWKVGGRSRYGYISSGPETPTPAFGSHCRERSSPHQKSG